MQRCTAPPWSLGLQKSWRVGGSWYLATCRLVDALVFHCRDGHHRQAQLSLHGVDAYRAPVVAHLVHHVQCQHHGHIELHELHGEIQVALDVGGIDDVDDALGVGFQDELARHDFLVGVGRERVDARQVGHRCVGVSLDGAALLVDGHSREVAHVLIGAGELVEQGGFAAILVAGKGKGEHGALGQGVLGLAVVLPAHLAIARVILDCRSGVIMAVLDAGITVGAQLHFNLGCIVLAQGQAVAMQHKLYGIAHGGIFHQCHFHAGYHSHVEEVLAQGALSTHCLDGAGGAFGYFVECHLLLSDLFAGAKLLIIFRNLTALFPIRPTKVALLAKLRYPHNGGFMPAAVVIIGDDVTKAALGSHCPKGSLQCALPRGCGKRCTGCLTCAAPSCPFVSRCPCRRRRHGDP